MSTILDALKKSEQEREIKKVPTLSDIPAPHEPQRWPQFLLWIILLLLLVLIGLAVKLVMFPSGSGSALLNLPASVQKVNVSVDEESFEDEVVDVGGSEEIPGDEIEVNVVSYSEDPEKRFVMIGGKLLREGEFVRTGLKVEEIRQDEVVLNLRGEQIIRHP